MKKIEIITDEHRHHVYVGKTDFWLLRNWWNCTRNWDTSSCNRQKKQE
nr:MAG TPA: hypothetical protein [Caudoviricetes sp.]